MDSPLCLFFQRLGVKNRLRGTHKCLSGDRKRGSLISSWLWTPIMVLCTSPSYPTSQGCWCSDRGLPSHHHPTKITTLATNSGHDHLWRLGKYRDRWVKSDRMSHLEKVRLVGGHSKDLSTHGYCRTCSVPQHSPNSGTIQHIPRYHSSHGPPFAHSESRTLHLFFTLPVLFSFYHVFGKSTCQMLYAKVS